MTMNNASKFGLEDDEFETQVGSYEQDAVDEFEIGGEVVVRMGFANSVGRSIVGEDGEVTDITAVGWTIDVSRAPEKLTDALVVLEKKGAVVAENIQYGSGKVVPSYIFQRKTGQDKRGLPTYDRSVCVIPLVHSVPSKGSIAKSIDKQKGLVYGTYTDYDPTKNKHTTGGYCGFQAILPDLYEAGYRGENGEALPILIRLKGSSSKELYDAVAEHGTFIKSLRDHKMKELIAAKNDPAKVKRMVSKRVNMFTYWMKLSPSDSKHQHGGDKDNQKVYEVVNKMYLYSQLTDAYESLYVGKNLHAAICPLVYAEPIPGQPLVAGGDAVVWSQQHMAYQESQQDIWNPNRDLQYKSNQDAPVWMTNIYAKIKAGTYDKNAEKPSTNGADPAQPAQSADETQGMIDFVKAANKAFKDENNVAGLALCKDFQSVADSDEPDAAEQDAQMNDLFGQISAMRRSKRRMK